MIPRSSPFEVISPITQQDSENSKISERAEAVEIISNQAVDPSPGLLARLKFKGQVRALCLISDGKVTNGDLGLPENEVSGILKSIPAFREDAPTPQCYNVKLGEDNVLGVYSDSGLMALIHHLNFEDTNSLVSEASECLKEFQDTGKISPAPLRVVGTSETIDHVASELQIPRSGDGSIKTAESPRPTQSVPFPTANEPQAEAMAPAFAAPQNQNPSVSTPMSEPAPQTAGLAYRHLYEFLAHLLAKVATSGQIEGILNRVTGNMGLSADTHIPVDRCLEIGRQVFEKVPDRMKRKALIAELESALSGLR